MSRLGRSRIKVIVAAAVVVCATFTSVCVVGVLRVRRAQLETLSKAGLFKLAYAMHEYEDALGSLPPAVGPVKGSTQPQSWRVVLEFFHLGPSNADIGYDANAEWSSERNLQAAASLSKYMPFSRFHPDAITRFCVIVGPNTAFPSSSKAIAFEEIKDGLENTVLVIEHHASGIIWTEPRDVTIEDLPKWLSTCFDHRNLYPPSILFADGEAFRIKQKPSVAEMIALATIDGNEPLTRRELIERGVLVPLFSFPFVTKTKGEQSEPELDKNSENDGPAD